MCLPNVPTDWIYAPSLSSEEVVSSNHFVDSAGFDPQDVVLGSTEVGALSTLTCSLASALRFFCDHCIFQGSKCKSTKSRNPHGDLRASVADLIYNTVSVTKV